MRFIIYFAAVFLLLFNVSCIVSEEPNMSFLSSETELNKDVKFESINVPMWVAKPVIKKQLRNDGENDEIIALIKKLKDVKVMTVTSNKTRVETDFSNYLKKNRFEEWMTIKKANEIISFHAKQNGDVIKNFLVTLNSGNEAIYVDVKGNFTREDLSKIINYSEKKDINFHNN